MAKVRFFVIIGLGSFGSAVARRLTKNGCRVTGIDMSPVRVEAVKNDLYEALIGDATERNAMQNLALDKADGVIISMGEDIERSLLATLHAKELHAKHIVVKAVSEDHGRLLKYLGVDRVIFPEVDIAVLLADQETWPNMLDLLAIDEEFSFFELAIPNSITGKSLIESDLRRKYGVWVVGIKDALTGKLQMFPDAKHVFQDDQILLILGKTSDLEKFRSVE
jgi:trk system potassium uptake protein